MRSVALWQVTQNLSSTARRGDGDGEGAGDCVAAEVMLELPERRTEPPTESRATVHTSSVRRIPWIRRALRAVTSADTHISQGISTLGADYRSGPCQRQPQGADLTNKGSRRASEGYLPGPRKRDAGELPESTKRRLRGVETETKVFLRIVLVFVRGLMMVGV